MAFASLEHAFNYILMGLLMTASPRKINILKLQKVLALVLVVLTSVVMGLFYLKTQFSRPAVETSTPVEVKVGSLLPFFSLTSYAESELVPISKIDARVILLNFWATWCDACMEEMPSLVQLRNRFHKDGFEVVAVNLDENPNGAIEKTKTKYQISFPLFKDLDGKVAELFDVHAIPATFIFDQNRKVLHLKEGGHDWFSRETIELVQRWLKP